MSAFIVKISVSFGHFVSKVDLIVSSKKTQAMQEIKTPKTIKNVQRLIGKIKWSSRFVKYHDHVTSLHHWLTRKRVKFKWTRKFQKGF